MLRKPHKSLKKWGKSCNFCKKFFFWSRKIGFLKKKFYFKINFFSPKTLFFTTKKVFFPENYMISPPFLGGQTKFPKSDEIYKCDILLPWILTLVVFCTVIVAVISVCVTNKKCPHASLPEKKSNNCFCCVVAFSYYIVANGKNGLDVDKMDYLLRDARSTNIGIPLNMIHLQRIFAHSRVTEERDAIYFDCKMFYWFTRSCRIIILPF